VLLNVQLLCTVNRIKSFSVMSPLTRFITGLELLLQTSQMWDRDAPTSLKLTDQLMPVVELIKRWRKLEYRSDFLSVIVASVCIIINAGIFYFCYGLHQKTSFVSLRPHSSAHLGDSSTQRPTLPSWPSIRSFTWQGLETSSWSSSRVLGRPTPQRHWICSC